MIFIYRDTHGYTLYNHQAKAFTIQTHTKANRINVNWLRVRFDFLGYIIKVGQACVNAP